VISQNIIAIFVNVKTFITMTEKKFTCSSEDLKKIRKITGLTQTTFAREIGLAGASAISMIEKGRAKPSGSTWFAVKKRFGHLFEIQDRDGVHYIEPRPQSALTAQEGGDQWSNEELKGSLAALLPSHILDNADKLKLNQEKLEEAVFKMLKTVLRSSNEKAKIELLSYIIMWNNLIAGEDKETSSTKTTKK